MGGNETGERETKEVDIESLLIEFLERPDIDFNVPGSSEIINQLERTLLMLQKVEIPEKKIRIFLEAVAGLWKKYTTPDGQIETRAREPKPELTHALEVTESSLEVLYEAHELREIFGIRESREIGSLWDRRTEVAFVALHHDTIEDEKFTEEELVQFLSSIGIPESMAKKWTDEVMLLSRLKDEKGDYKEGLQGYLDTVNQSLISRFIKISGDILRNAQSVLKSKKQRYKFRDGYGEFFKQHFSWIQKLPAFECALKKIKAVNPDIAELLIKEDPTEKVRAKVAQAVSAKISPENGKPKAIMEPPDEL